MFVCLFSVLRRLARRLEGTWFFFLTKFIHRFPLFFFFFFFFVVENSQEGEKQNAIEISCPYISGTASRGALDYLITHTLTVTHTHTQNKTVTVNRLLISYPEIVFLNFQGRIQ